MPTVVVKNLYSTSREGPDPRVEQYKQILALDGDVFRSMDLSCGRAQNTPNSKPVSFGPVSDHI